MDLNGTVSSWFTRNFHIFGANIPGLGLGGGDRNLVLLSIVEEIVAASETVVEFRETPWGDDFDRWL